MCFMEQICTKMSHAQFVLMVPYISAVQWMCGAEKTVFSFQKGQVQNSKRKSTPTFIPFFWVLSTKSLNARQNVLMKSLHYILLS